MFYLYRTFLPMKDPLHMHQTTHIGRGYEFGSVPHMIFNPILPHLHADGLFGYAKCSTKATALIASIEVDQLNIL